MIFRQLFEPVSSTYTYLLGCEETGQALLIDAVLPTWQRDLEELKADVAAAKAVGNEPSTAVLDRLAELTRASGLQSASSTAAARKDACNGGKPNRTR